MNLNARGLLSKAAFLLATLGLMAVGHATPLKITLTGNVQSSEVPEILADTFTKFVVTYDSGLVPTTGTPPLIAIYGSPASTWSIQIGSYVTSGVGGAVGVREALLLGDDGFFGQIVADPSSNSPGTFAPGSGLGGLPLFSASFDLSNSTQDLWSGLDLPTSVFPYDEGLLMLDFFIKSSGFNTDKQVRANIISFTIEPFVAQTPLPATLPLFATGLGVLGAVTWRRMRKTRGIMQRA